MFPIVSHEPNLLVNGEFESSLDGWNVETGILWSDGGGASASGALLMNAPQIESNSRFIYSKSASQCVLLGDGALFSIDAHFRYLDKLPERASVNRLNIIWYESLDCTKGGQFGYYLEPELDKEGWQQVFRINLKPSLGANSAKIEIEQNQRGNNNAKAVWDNISFSISLDEEIKGLDEESIERYTKPLGENYLLNSSFDKNLDVWLTRPSKRLSWRGLDEADRGGVISAKLSNTKDASIGTGAFSQCVNIGANQRFELGALVKVAGESSQRGGGRLRPTWYENFDCDGRHRTSSKHADVDRDKKGWQVLHVADLKPLHNAKSARIAIGHSIDGKGEHVLLWDDIYFKAY